MQQCPSCKTEVSSENQYCPYCGKRLRDTRHTVDVHHNPHQQVTMPPGYLEGEGPRVHSTEQPLRYKADSPLKIDSKRYFSWLREGLLGSEASIHPLLAAIIPFVITLFSTLAAAPYFAWRAGPFFLFWLLTIITYGVMLFGGYLVERSILKGNKDLKQYFSRFSSLQTMILPLTLFAFVVNLFTSPAYKVAHYYAVGGEFWFIFTRLIPILLLISTYLSLSFEKRERRKQVFATLVVAVVFCLSLSLIIYVFNHNIAVTMANRVGDFFNIF
ncbi:MAG: zinc ribbon domain-containing protein [Eubacteriales bacterium]|nr:zinc ribbon domain-containing protein [Eubacteriales bacterium]